MKFKSLYVTSVERYSGKTAVCLALARRFQADGYRVGYMKPVSLQPYRVSGHITDEDAAFVKEICKARSPSLGAFAGGHHARIPARATAQP